MKALVSTHRRTERVFLIGAQFSDRSAEEVGSSLQELAQLARTAGGEIGGDGIQRLPKPQAGTFIGSGKAAEFADVCRRSEVDTVIFDDELSPAQARNLESVFECKVLDRTSLILDIFAQRARTKEGKLQVELAQLQHLLPRLTRFWSHLSRQKGGIGMRGDGETQLETDRRRVQDRISHLARDLEVVRRQRQTQRQGRQRRRWPLASIVGYTNAGKSTLFNALSGASVLAEDKLFATLDPTTRRLRLPTNQNVLLSDTVGFIRKLPHNLVDAFKATLEEVVEADLLVHVVDVTHPQAEAQMRAVNDVLTELGVHDRSTLVVLNKIDQLSGAVTPAWMKDLSPCVAVSARTGEGIETLQANLGTMLRPRREVLRLAIPHSEAEHIAKLYAVGQVLERRYDGSTAFFTARVPPHHVAVFQSFICDDAEEEAEDG